LLDEPTTGVDAVSRREFWELLAQLKASGLTIVVSTPYMDEAGRCDRVALVQRGRILELAAPGVIGSRYRHPLIAVRGGDRQRVLAALREFPHVHSAFPFGETIHYADARSASDPAAIARELTAWLAQRGQTDARAEPAQAGIEDVFMDLMETPAPQAAA
jgi:drug efflux transport system ATP-binding protein